MTPEQFDFRVGVINPVECIKEGWGLIKDQYWLFFGISIVAMLISGLFQIVLLGPMMVGVFLCLFRRQRGQPVEFGLLFKGFDYFVEGIVAAALKEGPKLILMVPLLFVTFLRVIASSLYRSGDLRDFVIPLLALELILSGLLMIIGILIEIAFMFAFPLIADRKLSGLQAVKLSIRAAKANFGGILGLVILNGLLFFVGLLCCIVGAYFYVPVMFAAQAVAYRRVFPEVPETFASPPPPPASWA